MKRKESENPTEEKIENTGGVVGGEAGGKIVWTEAQQRLLDLAPFRKNIYVAGPAGSGKSACLRELVRRERGRGRVVAVTAMTGIAAVQLSGVTIHSWSGIGLGNQSVENYINKLCKQRAQRDSAGWRWTHTDLLIIDEISMCSNDLFSKLDLIGREVRGHKAIPFGGLQIIVFGDFHQLPAIEERKERGKENDMDDKSDQIPLFESDAFLRSIPLIIYLSRVFRQSDPRLIDLFGHARTNTLSDAHMEFLRSRIKPRDQFDRIVQRMNQVPGWIEPTYLHPTKAQVKEYNDRRLKQLRTSPAVNKPFNGVINHCVRVASGEKGEVQTNCVMENLLWTSYARTSPRSVELQNLAKQFKSQVPVDMAFHVKTGAQVMLVSNLSVATGLANGTRGRVVHIGADPPSEDVLKALKQTPAKSAPTTMELPAGEEEEEEEETLEEETLQPVPEPAPDRPRQIWVLFENQPEPIAVAPYRWKRAIQPEDAHRDQEQWSEWIEIVQLPLILCWALTIHKSQGQTLSSVYLYLGPKIRTPGQAYVALSRVRSLDGLWIEIFSRKAFQCDDRVCRFEEIISSLGLPRLPESLFLSALKSSTTVATRAPVAKKPKPAVVGAAPEPIVKSPFFS